jgi:hypothetical protein
MAFKKKTYSPAEKAEFKAANDRRVKAAGDSIVKQFEAGDLPEKLAPIFLNAGNKPSDTWSLSNRLLMVLAGSTDARGYNDWKKAGRQVRKGEKTSVFILQPNKFTITTEDKNGDEQTRTFLRGFNASGRFDLGQTDVSTCQARKGTTVCIRCKKTVDAKDPKTCDVSAAKWAESSEGDKKTADYMRNLPLREVAESWGLEVSAYSGKWGNAQGCYWRSIFGENSGINVGVANLATWAHELVHAADDKLNNLVESGQHHKSETVAELGGAILLRVMGFERDADIGGAWHYITAYCERANVDPLKACMDVLKRISEAVSLILEAAEHLKTTEKVADAVA